MTACGEPILCQPAGLAACASKKCGMRLLLGRYGRLCRWRLSFAAAATVAACVLLERPGLDLHLVAAAAGAFAGSAACSAVNQMQERELDAFMVRTRNRPLVTGELSLKNATMTAVFLLAASSGLLYLAGGPAALGVLLFIVLCYNLGYTLLKRKSGWHLLPGVVAGGLPVLLGAVCGGAAGFRAWSATLFALMVAWQLDHFRLLASRHGADYQAAGVRLPWYFEARFGELFRRSLGLLLGFVLMLCAGSGLMESVAGALFLVGLGLSCIIFHLPRRPAVQPGLRCGRWAVVLVLAAALGERFLLW